MGQLHGKIAVVTGASSGSGVGITQRFIEEGATVVMLARGQERLDDLASSLGEGAVPVATDLGDPDSVRATFEQVRDRFGKLDILINNAAVYRPSPVEKLSDVDIGQTLATNLSGVMYTCREAIPLMKSAGCGDIVNVSSESTIDPFPYLSVYVASKAGLEAFTPILAEEVRDDDIRVTTLIQGTAQGPGGGTLDFQWDPEMAALAGERWTELGLLNRVSGFRGGQQIEDIGDVHMFIVTRPRTQRMDVVRCRSF
jgi:NAD(P)-dependent dehydrogenase (short-subunit alcohol dehydrogenase family)